MKNFYTPDGKQRLMTDQKEDSENRGVLGVTDHNMKVFANTVLVN